jgi:hypothetical protein
MPKYKPDTQVARERYSVHPTTLWRWDRDPTLGFPPPIRINNRKYRDVEALDAWDRIRAAEPVPAIAPPQQRRDIA